MKTQKFSKDHLSKAQRQDQGLWRQQGPRPRMTSLRCVFGARAWRLCRGVEQLILDRHHSDLHTAKTMNLNWRTTIDWSNSHHHHLARRTVAGKQRLQQQQYLAASAENFVTRIAGLYWLSIYPSSHCKLHHSIYFSFWPVGWWCAGSLAGAMNYTAVYIEHVNL